MDPRRGVAGGFLLSLLQTPSSSSLAPESYSVVSKREPTGATLDSVSKGDRNERLVKARQQVIGYAAAALAASAPPESIRLACGSENDLRFWGTGPRGPCSTHRPAEKLRESSPRLRMLHPSPGLQSTRPLSL